MQSFWRSFPQIYQYFGKDPIKSLRYLLPFVQNVNTSSPKNLDWPQAASSSNSRFYLTEFCLYYLLPSYYIIHTTPVDVLPPISALSIHRSHGSLFPNQGSPAAVTELNSSPAVAKNASTETPKVTESSTSKQVSSTALNKKRIVLSTTPKLSNTATFTATSISTTINSPANTVNVFQSIDSSNNATAAANPVFALSITNPSSNPLFAPPLSTPPTTKTRKVIDDKASTSSSKNPSVTTTPRRSTTKKMAPSNNNPSSNTLASNSLPRNSPVKSISHSSLNLLNKFNATSPSPATLLNLSHANSLDYQEFSLIGNETKKQLFPEQMDAPTAVEFSTVEDPDQAIPIPTSLAKEYLKE
jgi:hypothetical protein